MADIELVVKIPEDLCTKIYSDAEIPIYGGRSSGKTLLATLLRAIRNGVLLPKGHGRLIDVSQLLTVTECKEDGTERCYVPYVHIEEAETIIEAESEDDECKGCYYNDGEVHAECVICDKAESEDKE